MLELDHIAVAGQTLQLATDHVEKTVGLPLQAGGKHDVFFTHNTLLGLKDELYLEAIAIDPDAPEPDRPRWFDLDRFSGKPRLTNWICRCDDLDVALASLPKGFGEPVSLQRGDLRWRMAVPQSGILPFDNCAPALIQWACDVHPAQVLATSNCRLTKLTVTHPEADDLEKLLEPILNDERICYRLGGVGLAAEFETSNGAVRLT